MSDDTRTPGTLHLQFDGHAIEAVPGTSLLQAWTAAGLTLTENVGCMGQGVCGACRVLVRRPGQRLATVRPRGEPRLPARDGQPKSDGGRW